MRFNKKLLIVLPVVLLVLSTCCLGTVWAGKRALNWASFEVAWWVVNKSYFDPTFGGVDWEGLRTRYRRQVAFASDAEYYRLVNEMLWQVGISHLAMVPPGYWPRVEPTVLAEGSTGIDLRLLDGEAVITSIEPGSAADEAGLRPGFVIQQIDGRTVKQIAEEAVSGMEPPENERHRSEAIASTLLGQLYGPSGEKVTIAYLDEEGRQRQCRIMRRSRPDGIETGLGLPATYLEFEATRLDGGIGYIRFNGFHGDLAERLPRAIASLRSAPGLIIDLRGNPGGMRDAAVAGVESLVSERCTCATLHNRDGIHEVTLDPRYLGYRGPVVVLIDAMSKSSSEFFAACTQAIGRAAIIGERSPGSVGPASLLPLPNGATLIYPTAQEHTLDGTILEDHGVIPDIEVSLDRELLAHGIDTQLQAAIDHIEARLVEAE